MIELQQLLSKLLEQTPVIIVLGLGIWDFRRRLNEKEAEVLKVREVNIKSIENLNKAHGSELKQLYNDAHTRELNQIETLKNLTDIIEDLSDNFKK